MPQQARDLFAGDAIQYPVPNRAAERTGAPNDFFVHVLCESTAQFPERRNSTLFQDSPAATELPTVEGDRVFCFPLQAQLLSIANRG